MNILTENIPLVLSVSSFLIIATLFLVLASFLSVHRRKNSLIKRATKYLENPDETEVRDGPQQANSKRGVLNFLWLFKKSKKERNTSIYADTPLFYQRAGIYNQRSIRLYRSLRVILLLAPVAVIVSTHVIYNRPFNKDILIFILVLAYLGYFLPVLWLKLKAIGRRKELNRTFPDAMDLLKVCVEAGMGVDAAIRRVSQEIYITSPELAKEFKILSLELKTGKNRNSCLKNLAQRANLPDIDNLVSLLIQADKYGTGVANALKVHAEEMRQRRYSRLEEQSAKLPVKLIVPLILFIFPAFFIVIAGPTVIQVIRIFLQR